MSDGGREQEQGAGVDAEADGAAEEAGCRWEERRRRQRSVGVGAGVRAVVAGAEAPGWRAPVGAAVQEAPRERAGRAVPARGVRPAMAGGVRRGGGAAHVLLRALRLQALK